MQWILYAPCNEIFTRHAMRSIYAIQCIFKRHAVCTEFYTRHVMILYTLCTEFFTRHVMHYPNAIQCILYTICTEFFTRHTMHSLSVVHRVRYWDVRLVGSVTSIKTQRTEKLHWMPVFWRSACSQSDNKSRISQLLQVSWTKTRGHQYQHYLWTALYQLYFAKKWNFKWKLPIQIVSIRWEYL